MSDTPETSAAPRWRALERQERRVVGVLAEKAKTTPENYPLTVNSLINGCNQKSNRFPQMTLDEDAVVQALDSLRHAGAVSMVQGDGRVDKYRHLLYEWLGVDKAELAVMTELLLRGAQTLGELRGRAARMEPIKEIGDLLPIVDRLREKRLVIYLSPPGRGAVVTHNLYQPQELEKVRAEHGGGGAASKDDAAYRQIVAPTRAACSPAAADAAPLPRPQHDEAPASDQLRTELAALKRELAELREHADGSVADLRREVEELRRQLGG
jgi:uncharacterized protein YceH (UPF0502 family)